MKRIALALIASAAFTLPANAQSFNGLPSFQHWNLNTMTTDEQARINAGVRNGSLTRNEASKLQAQLNRVNDLKRRLSANGLTYAERQKIDNELDKVAEKIFRESNDNQRANWLGSQPQGWTSNFFSKPIFNGGYNINTSDEQARINAGLRNGSLTRAEAARLQTKLNEIISLKNRLSRGGLTVAERNRIDARLDALNAEIRAQSTDNQVAGRNGYGKGHKHDFKNDYKKDRFTYRNNQDRNNRWR
ncbi:MAG: hypothetical protein KC777_09255 [Cyanobacteria bacterium HKST-UBA02]|nr:hypothetical protein [Cyanobacteria bacterium HKST-UBA02]